MISYRDMIFCPFYGNCKHADACPLPLTEDVKSRAIKSGLPISRFLDFPMCHSEFENERSELENNA